MLATSANPLLGCRQIEKLYRLRHGTVRRAALANLVPSVTRPRGQRQPVILITAASADAYWGEK